MIIPTPHPLSASQTYSTLLTITPSRALIHMLPFMSYLRFVSLFVFCVFKPEGFEKWSAEREECVVGGLVVESL